MDICIFITVSLVALVQLLVMSLFGYGRKCNICHHINHICRNVEVSVFSMLGHILNWTLTRFGTEIHGFHFL